MPSEGHPLILRLPSGETRTYLPGDGDAAWLAFQQAPKGSKLFQDNRGKPGGSIMTPPIAEK